MKLEEFSKDILNKDIPPNLLKLIIHSLATNTNEIDVNIICEKMFISKMKLMGEIRRTKDIDGFLSIEVDNDTNYNLLVLNSPIKVIVSNKTKKIKKPSFDAAIDRVFEHWKNVMNRPRTKLDQNRIRHIKNGLLLSTEESLINAITGCSKTPWNMGYNNKDNKTEFTGKYYNNIDFIFRNIDNIERFCANCQLPSVEEQIEKIKQSTPESISSKLQNNDWLSKRSKSFGFVETESINEIPQPERLSIDYKKKIDPNKVNEIIAQSEEYFITGHIKSDVVIEEYISEKENTYSKEDIIEEAEITVKPSYLDYL